MDELDRRRAELTELLTSALAEDRIPQQLFEELIGAVEEAKSFQEIARVARTVAVALRTVGEIEGSAGTSDAAPTGRDEAAVGAIVEAFYAAISYRGERRPDLEAVTAVLDDRRALFVHGGDTMDVGQFWHFRVATWIRWNKFPFRQREISASTVIYGRMAHRLSVYAGEMADGTAIGRGVNSFQLALVEAGWRIVSVVWEEEREDLPIPDDLMGRDEDHEQNGT